MIFLLPSLISIVQGYYLLSILVPRSQRPAMPLFIFTGSLLGMITTAMLTSASALFFNAAHPAYAISINLAATTGLFFWARRHQVLPPFAKGNWDKIDLIGLHLILLLHIPILIHALRHADTAAHTFLAPFIHAWAWCFSASHDHVIIIVTELRLSLIFTGILFFGLKSFYKKPAPGLILLWIVPIMLAVQIAARRSEDLLLIACSGSAVLAFTLLDMRRHHGNKITADRKKHDGRP
ncbi:MAG: hypothetical protein WCI27_02915 [Candidatus Omnitrophota bacterium]